MEERELTYLQKILEEGSFSKAAQKLFIAQPSLSQYVKKVEAELGAPLFDRMSKPLKLTYAGEIYLRTEKRIRQLKREMRQQIDDLSKLKKGHLSIGSSHYRSSYLLTNVLPVFKERYPGIEISLEEGTTVELEEYAMNGVTDFSIVLLPLTYPALAYEELFQEEVLLAISSKHPLARFAKKDLGHLPPYPQIDFSLLRDEPFIIMKPGQKLRLSFFDLCEKAKFKPNIILESQSMAAAQSLAAVGVGATLVPDILAIYNNLPEPPCYFSLKAPAPPRQVVVAFSREKYLSKAAEAFIEVMKEVVFTQIRQVQTAHAYAPDA